MYSCQLGQQVYSKMKHQKTTHFWAMMKKLFFGRFLHENGMKRNPIHAAETHNSIYHPRTQSNKKNSTEIGKSCLAGLFKSKEVPEIGNLLSPSDLSYPILILGWYFLLLIHHYRGPP